VLKGRKVQLDHKEALDQLEVKVIQVTTALLLGQLDHKGRKVQLDHKAVKVIQATEEIQDLLDHKDY
jgi:hypothetical protein